MQTKLQASSNAIYMYEKRIIKKSMPKRRENVSRVKPQLEYAAPVWDPHIRDKIS